MTQRTEIEVLRSFYEAAKQYDIWLIAKAQVDARMNADTLYRDYLQAPERSFDEAIQVVEDWKREATELVE